MSLNPKVKYSIAGGFAFCLFAPVAYLAIVNEPYTAVPSVVASANQSRTQPNSDQAITELEAGLNTVPGISEFVSDVRPGLIEEIVEIEMTSTFETQSKSDREGLAVALWEAWVSASRVEDVDKAHIRLVDSQGKQIGGSKAIAGSVIYVDD